MSGKIRVFHVEDYKIVRDGVEHLLSAHEGIEYVGGMQDPNEFLKIVHKKRIDILILDIYLDGMEDVQTMNGFQVCQYVTDNFPHIKVIANSAYNDADRITRILKAGAKGFVSKKSGFAELLEAIYTVSRGDIFICQEISGKLKNLGKFLLGIEGSLRRADEVFSTREREVADLLSEGKSSKEIGEALSITERTVETHRKNMLDKANVKNTVELVAHMAALGLLKK